MLRGEPYRSSKRYRPTLNVSTCLEGCYCALHTHRSNCTVLATAVLIAEPFKTATLLHDKSTSACFCSS